jgi:hypothetical protein
MKIDFDACGLRFRADVHFDPGVPAFISGRPEDCHEGEPPEVDFRSLTCGGRDAMFLLDCDLTEEIYDAAILAAESAYEPGCG